MKPKHFVFLLLLAGCSPSKDQTSAESPFNESRPDSSTSNRSANVHVGGATTTNELSALTEEGQITVVVCEYVVREVIESDIVIFHSLKESEAQVLASRLPKRCFRSVTKAERDKETGDFRDKLTKEWGMELEVGRVEVMEPEAYVRVLWAYGSAFHFYLEKGNNWRIRKVERSFLDGPRRN